MREYFKDLPDETTPLSADRINGLLNGEESIEKIVVGDIECKNLLKNTAKSKTENGVTFTVNSDGTVHVKGTATADTFLRVTHLNFYLPAGMYTLSGGYANSTSFISYQGQHSNGEYFTGSARSTGWREFEVVDGDIMNFIQIRIGSGTTLDYTFKPQLEKGAIATPYAPYKKFGYDSINSMGKIVVDDISCKNKLNLSMRTYGVRTNGTSVADAFEDLSSDEEIKIKPLSLGAFFPFQVIVNNLKKNTNYTLSSTFIGTWQVYVYTDKLYGNVLFSQPLRNSNTFNTGDNTSIVLGFYSYNNPIDANYSISNILLEEGTVATEYTPYKNFEGREDIITGQECPTNRYVDGKRVYVKRISVGSLPNSKSVTFATGIPSTYAIDDVNARAIGTDDGKTFLKMPFSTGIVYSAWVRNGAYVLEISTTDDRSLLNGIFDFYYTKN